MTKESNVQLQDVLCTPLARSVARLERVHQRGTASEWLAALYLAEATLKLHVLIGVSGLAALDRTRGLDLGYQLARADSIGTWTQVLSTVAGELHRLRADGWMREFVVWVTSNRKREKHKAHWFEEATSRASRLWRALGESAFDFSPSVEGLFSFLATLRNRTRGHGALVDEFYEKHNDDGKRYCVALLEGSVIREADLIFTWDRRADGQILVRSLVGTAPSKSLYMKADRYQDRALYFRPRAAGNPEFYVLPLLKYDPYKDFCHFANGAWLDRDHTAEFIDYFSGELSRFPVPELAVPPIPKPPSESAGLRKLDWGQHAAHNLPGMYRGYVTRPSLERDLLGLLKDRVHRVITLHGRGGTGKTSLALEVAHSLCDESGCCFDVILWFSARDVDLLVEGSKERSRDVTDLESIARLFCKLMGLETDDAVTAFLSEIHRGEVEGVKYLLIMDNFETLDAPVEVHRVLDEQVLPPNKVLITSREHGFKGDYPLNVRGMEPAEARELILQEARRSHCEPLCTDKLIQAIITATDAIPYAMKLVVAHLASGTSPEKVIRDVSARPDILDALFRRSYDSLSPEAQHTFLLLGQVGERLPEIPLAIVAARRGWRLEATLDELERFSLVDVATESVGQWLSLPLVTRRFAQKKLIGDDRESLVQEDAKLVRDVRPLSHESPHQAVGYAKAISRLLTDLAKEKSGEARERSALLEAVLENLAESYPETWSFVAWWRRDAARKPALVREAFKRAVEESPYDSKLWAAWAMYEAQQGEQLRALELRLRALELGGDELEEASQLAGEVARVISDQKRTLSMDKRRVYLAHLRELLSKHESELGATQLSRLAWLYLLEGNLVEARRLAEKGLAKEPHNEHCWAISRKLS